MARRWEEGVVVVVGSAPSRGAAAAASAGVAAALAAGVGLGGAAWVAADGTRTRQTSRISSDVGSHFWIACVS